MEKIVKKSKVLNVIVGIILSIIVVLIAFNFIAQKENMTIDELYTYGLANTSFQPEIEDYKEYSGKEVFLNYSIVKSGHEFDAKKVFFNQTMDTHPPLYYLLVNFICSIRKNKFSMWHGLIINLIFLVAVYWEMRALLYLVIKDKMMSSILPLIAFFTYGFTNEIGFTRMYVMLSAISMAFVLLIIYKMQIREKKALIDNDIIFLILFFILCVLGILTQYHFALIGFFFSLIFAIYLIRNKNYKLLSFTAIVGVVSLFISYLIFPAMLKHIFGGGSLHSLAANESTSLLSNFSEMFLTIKRGFFGNGIYAYLIILIVLFIVNAVIAKRNKEKNVVKYFNKYYVYFLVCVIYYYIVISIFTKFTFERYFYNIYPLIVVVILAPIYFLLKNIKNVLKYITAAILFMLCITSTIEKAPTNLCIGDALFEEYLYSIKSTKTILVYHSMDENGNTNSMSGTSKWKLPYPFYLFRHMENMTFVDAGDMDSFRKTNEPTISGHNDIVLVVYNTQNDTQIINALAQKNNVPNVQKLYFTSYIHVYRLFAD